jgi:hypothetical protein
MYLRKNLHPISTVDGRLAIFYISQNQKVNMIFLAFRFWWKNKIYLIVSRFIIKKLMYSLFFSQIFIWNSNNKEMWCHGPRVNKIHRVLLLTMNNSSTESSPERNEKVKHAGMGKPSGMFNY